MNMKAITVLGQNNIVMRDEPVRELEPDEVLCRVVYTGVCGTDLAIYAGTTTFVTSGQIKYPVRIGHEWSGYVVKCGKDVTLFKEGDRVVSETAVACRKCEACAKGDFANCKHTRSVGTIDAWDGSYAEYVIFPESHLYHLPDEISYEQGAMIEPLQIAYAGMRKFTITKDSVVAVIGTGPIGMCCVALAKAMGAGKIIMIGRTDFKLEVAKKMGATDTINIRSVDAVEELMRITNGHGADCIAETSGANSTVQQCIAIAAKRAFVVMLGFYETKIDGLDFSDAIFKELTFRGIMGEWKLVPQIIDYIMKSGLTTMPMVTRTIDFDDCVSYFENHESTHKVDIKTLVRITDVK